MRAILILLVSSFFPLIAFASPVHVLRAAIPGPIPGPFANVPLQVAPDDARRCAFEQAVHDKGDLIGQTSKASVNLTTYEGHPAALKVIGDQWTRNTDKEARNLHSVGQLLDWGFKMGGRPEEKKHFLMMKYMGSSLSKTGISSKTAHQLNIQAQERYRARYHMTNRDTNSDNFVYHRVANNKWQAEIVDWERGQWVGSGMQPVAPGPLIVFNPPRDLECQIV